MNDYKEYAIDELGESPYCENCAILTSPYNGNIVFNVYYPESVSESIEPHLMIYKCEYSIDVLNIVSYMGFCRLSVLEPKYITGYNEDYTLTKDEIEFLYNELTRKWDDDGSTRWDYINDCIHHNYEVDEIENPYSDFIEIPDYFKLV